VKQYKIDKLKKSEMLNPEQPDDQNIEGRAKRPSVERASPAY